MRAQTAPEGYDGEDRYTVQDEDVVNPDLPVYYTIDNSVPGAAFLACEQPGPWLNRRSYVDMFVSLKTLVELGELAKEILAGTAVSDEKLQEFQKQEGQR